MTVDRDAVLAAVARHHVVLAEQVAAASVYPVEEAESVLRSLVAARLLGRVRLLRNGPACYWITQDGLAAIDSDLPVPSFELGDVRRLIGAAWVAVRAADGRFPAAEGVFTARELRGVDAARSARGAHAVSLDGLFGLRVPGPPTGGSSAAHYPDVLIRFPDDLVAVEVVLGSLSARRLRGLLTAYGADARYGRAIFLVEEERTAREIETAAGSLGLAELVSAQWMQYPAA